MTTPSLIQDTGISIVYNSPSWKTSNTSGESIDNYNSYSHTKNAMGGYWSANIAFKVSQNEAEEWYINGLGRDIQTFNAALSEIWNGFVNEIEIRLGTFSATRGPLIKTANRVDLVYSTVDTATNPPIVGVRENVGLVNDTASQDEYGIIKKTLSTGGATPTTAAQIRDTYLQENKDPETSQQVTLGQSSEPTVVLKCLGYAHWLNLFTYATTTTGTRTYTNRIIDALGADPNAMFSTDYSKIATNAATVPYYDNDNHTAWQIIKGIVSKGDTSYNRYTFGIYKNKRAYYAAAPTELEYYHKIGDNKQRIELASDIEVKPWDVSVAKWLQVSDWLVGRIPVTTDFRKDPRNIFIESIQYTAPYGLSINGNKINTLPQVLGQLGLTGIGA